MNATDFVKDLQYVHIVVVLYRNEEGNVDHSVWVYKNIEDAQKRFEKLKAKHEANPHESPLIMTQSFMAGVYENFEQSVLAEGQLPGKAN